MNFRRTIAAVALTSACLSAVPLAASAATPASTASTAASSTSPRITYELFGDRTVVKVETPVGSAVRTSFAGKTVCVIASHGGVSEFGLHTPRVTTTYEITEERNGISTKIGDLTLPGTSESDLVANPEAKVSAVHGDRTFIDVTGMPGAIAQAFIADKLVAVRMLGASGTGTIVIPTPADYGAISVYQEVDGHRSSSTNVQFVPQPTIEATTWAGETGAVVKIARPYNSDLRVYDSNGTLVRQILKHVTGDAFVALALNAGEPNRFTAVVDMGPFGTSLPLEFTVNPGSDALGAPTGRWFPQLNRVYFYGEAGAEFDTVKNGSEQGGGRFENGVAYVFAKPGDSFTVSQTIGGVTSPVSETFTVPTP